MRVFVDGIRALRFDDGTPVTAASGIAPLGDGWLIAQDDSTFAAWRRSESIVPLRLLPTVDGHDRFSEAAGTKSLKPDLEATCPIEVDGEAAVLFLGSGSTPRRMRGVLVRSADGDPTVLAGDLGALYADVAQRLGLEIEQLNLEGASRHGDTLRWFNRGNLAAGVRSGSIDIPLDAMVDAVLGRVEAAAVPLRQPRSYDLGEVEGVGLAVTDAIALPDGRVLVSAAAEDTPNAVDDGPVVATALALVDGEDVLAVAPLPEVDGRVHKIEGLALHRSAAAELHLLAVVDADDPAAPSSEIALRVVLA
jgi:hypothetical protein